jgi:hypothetical protein
MIKFDPIELVTNVIFFLYPLIVLIGTLCNALAFIIFSRNKFKNSIFSTYFRYLTLNDTVSLLFLSLNKFLILKFDLYIGEISDMFCKLIGFSAYGIPAISSWILVIISFDRMINISFTQRFLFRKCVKFQVTTCIGIFLFNLTYYGHLFFSELYYTTQYDNVTNMTTQVVFCSAYETTHILSWSDLFNSTLIPFTLMIITTIITLKSLFKQRSKVKYTSVKSSNQNKISKSKDAKFACTSIALNIMFFLLNLPFCILSLLSLYLTIDDKILDLIKAFISILYYLNFLTVFFVNILFNSLFKTEFFSFFKY